MDFQGVKVITVKEETSAQMGGKQRVTECECMSAVCWPAAWLAYSQLDGRTFM